nr:MAG TPA: hypothetical protein [Caudoviricetes sp.]
MKQSKVLFILANLSKRLQAASVSCGIASQL